MSSRIRGVARDFREGIMKSANKRGMGKYLLLVLAVLAVGMIAGCRNNEVEVPPLTGPSGHTLFLTMEAAPDHLVIHAPGRPRETSQVTLQLKNQQGVGVSGENVKLRIANRDLAEINIGRLSDYNVTTDSAGFARVIYTAPDSGEQTIAIQVYVLAILTNPSYPYEVTDKHQLDLELSAVNPGSCIFGSANGPVPAFDASPSPGTINNPVCFNASGSTDNGIIVGFSWKFGDGTTGTGEVVCHEYSAEGSFNVTLLVQDEDRNCEEVTQTIVIGRGVPATCTIVTSPTAVTPNQDVNFTAITTDPDGSVKRFNWDFGDGSRTSTSRNTVTHRYRVIGSFNVILTIIDDQGNQSTCQASVSVTNGTLPSCAFTFGPVPVSLNDVVNFNASTSTDADGDIRRYSWNFGDGSASVTESDPLISHQFTVSGAFTVTLTVTDDDGNESTCSQAVTVISDPPVCAFNANPNNGSTPLNVSFDATASSDDTGIASFTWDFGDGGSGTGVTTNHVYTAPVGGQAFTATLTVTDDDGQAVSCSQQITVTNP